MTSTGSAKTAYGPVKSCFPRSGNHARRPINQVAPGRSNLGTENPSSTRTRDQAAVDDDGLVVWELSTRARLQRESAIPAISMIQSY